MVAGLIADTIPEDVVRTRCMVAQEESEFWPPRGQKFLEGDCRMRLALWIAFFVISNLLGIEAFKAAVTLPSDERLVPSLLTFPLIGLTALSATRVLEAWRRRDE